MKHRSSLNSCYLKKTLFHRIKQDFVLTFCSADFQQVDYILVVKELQDFNLSQCCDWELNTVQKHRQVQSQVNNKKTTKYISTSSTTKRDKYPFFLVVHEHFLKRHDLFWVAPVFSLEYLAEKKVICLEIFEYIDLFACSTTPKWRKNSHQATPLTRKFLGRLWQFSRTLWLHGSKGSRRYLLSSQWEWYCVEN